jgi:predicted protein tyrosine phosphatase
MSPTAEGLLKDRAKFEVCSAGTWIHAPKRVCGGLMDWADLVFAMEEHHKEALLELKPEAENKIIMLDISDVYPKNHPKLIEILEKKLIIILKINL